MNDFQYTGAFVVHFRAVTDFERGQISGRVEHVASGLTAHFTSGDELLERLARLWRHIQADDRVEPQGELQ